MFVPIWKRNGNKVVKTYYTYHTLSMREFNIKWNFPQTEKDIIDEYYQLNIDYLSKGKLKTVVAFVISKRDKLEEFNLLNKRD